MRRAVALFGALIGGAAFVVATAAPAAAWAITDPWHTATDTSIELDVTRSDALVADPASVEGTFAWAAATYAAALASSPAGGVGITIRVHTDIQLPAGIPIIMPVPHAGSLRVVGAADAGAPTITGGDVTLIGTHVDEIALEGLRFADGSLRIAVHDGGGVALRDLRMTGMSETTVTIDGSSVASVEVSDSVVTAAASPIRIDASASGQPTVDVRGTAFSDAQLDIVAAGTGGSRVAFEGSSFEAAAGAPAITAVADGGEVTVADSLVTAQGGQDADGDPLVEITDAAAATISGSSFVGGGVAMLGALGGTGHGQHGGRLDVSNSTFVLADDASGDALGASCGAASVCVPGGDGSAAVSIESSTFVGGGLLLGADAAASSSLDVFATVFDTADADPVLLPQPADGWTLTGTDNVAAGFAGGAGGWPATGATAVALGISGATDEDLGLREGAVVTLADNGGISVPSAAGGVATIPTVLPAAGSVLIDAVRIALDRVPGDGATDQRGTGFARVVGQAMDIGAIEQGGGAGGSEPGEGGADHAGSGAGGEGGSDDATGGASDDPATGGGSNDPATGGGSGGSGDPATGGGSDDPTAGGGSSGGSGDDSSEGTGGGDAAETGGDQSGSGSDPGGSTAGTDGGQTGTGQTGTGQTGTGQTDTQSEAETETQSGAAQQATAAPRTADAPAGEDESAGSQEDADAEPSPAEPSPAAEDVTGAVAEDAIPDADPSATAPPAAKISASIESSSQTTGPAAGLVLGIVSGIAALGGGALVAVNLIARRP